MSDPLLPTRTAGPEVADPSATVGFSAAPQPFTDYTPHARGGLGEVLRATDPVLNRTVAVKRLQENRAADPDSRRRFLVEAEITARLEHPGVVPVYELFTDDRGGPAYAMRFVQGPTLWDALTEYHAGPPDPIGFRRLLQSVIQVCQTVAYAHTRGVIHRDLKPQNVLLGKFGETLVVDWGLAKVVGRPEEDRTEALGEETLVPGSGGMGDETAMGSAVGTPAFMSPEQAAGRWNVIEQRSDVYGLGAVLFTVLTGKAPLESGDWPELQQRIQRGDIPTPHAVKPGVPPALEAICRKAMAVRPEDRFQSAADLAAEVEHWLADEPVSVYREPLANRLRRWGRRNRTLVRAAAVMLIAAVVGLAIGAALLQRARVETDRERAAAVSAQRKAELLNRFLIDDLLKQADPVNNPDGNKITVRQLLDKAAAKLDGGTWLEDQPDVEAELRSVIGHAYEYLDLPAKAEPHYQRAWQLRDRAPGADRRDTLAHRNRYIWAVGAQPGHADAEALAEDALKVCTVVLGGDNPTTAEAMSNLALVRLNDGRPMAAVPLLRQASLVSTASLGHNSAQTLEIDNDLGVALVMAGDRREAVDRLRSVVDRRRKLDPRHPELLKALSNLGGSLAISGRFEEAEPVLQEAIALCESRNMKKTGPALSARNLYGYVLEGGEKWKQAEDCYLAVLADRRDAAEPFEVERTLAPLARLYAKQKRWPDAAEKLSELLRSQQPSPPRAPDRLTKDLLAALTGSADPAGAESLLWECHDALTKRLAAGDWLTLELTSRYGDALRRQRKFDRAELFLTDSAREIEKAVGVPTWSVPDSRTRVIDLYQAWGKPEKAAEWKARPAGSR